MPIRDCTLPARGPAITPLRGGGGYAAAPSRRRSR